MASLASLFGQASAIRALRRALESGCLPGTYLFVGAMGVGKGALARAFAQAAACRNPRTDPFDSCGECDSCRRADAGLHPEIYPILPAGEQTQIWQFWDREGRAAPGVLSRTLSYAPNIGRKRVYIVERADTLTESAANSLLKALEETPPYALFLLLAPHPARVLPTIVSRSQMIRLNPEPVDDLSVYLRDTVGLEAGQASMLAAYSEGRVGQAVQFARNPAVGEEIARVLDFAETLPKAPRHRSLKLAEQMRKLAGQTKALVGEEPTAASDDEGEGAAPAKEKVGRRQLATVFDLLVVFYRDLLALRVGGATQPRLVNKDRSASLAGLSKAGDAVRWTGCLDALLQARRRLDANANVALVTEILAVRLTG